MQKDLPDKGPQGEPIAQKADPSPPTGEPLTWIEGDVPRSARFEDTYYAHADGRAEAAHVFLAGNGLPARWQVEGPEGGKPFTIAELGFGTGLNFLETWRQWRAWRHAREAPVGATALDFVSFERFPLAAADMARALAPWPQLQPLAEALLLKWPPLLREEGRLSFAFPPDVTLTLILGDANEWLPPWEGRAEAWFLDGFSPAKNRELWNEPLLAEVARHTAPGGTFASYTAAGWVRRGLTAAGFSVEKRPGFGTKREMIAGSLSANSL